MQQAFRVSGSKTDAKTKTKTNSGAELINTLQTWNKKPTLDNSMNDVIEDYSTIVNVEEQVNYPEAGTFIHEGSVYHAKQVDLLYDEFIKFHKKLCEIYEICTKREATPPRNKNEVMPSTSSANVDPPTSTSATSTEIPVQGKEKRGKKRKNVEELKVDDKTEDTIKKEDFAGLPKELLERLNLLDQLSKEEISKLHNELDSNHPLYNLISKAGKDTFVNKNTFTIENLSLSGNAWLVFHKIEEILAQIASRQADNSNGDDDHPNEECFENSNPPKDSETETEVQMNISAEPSLYDSGFQTLSSIDAENTPQILNNTTVEQQEMEVGTAVQENTAEGIDGVEPPTPNNDNENPQNIPENIQSQMVPNVTINFLKLPINILRKTIIFRLPSDYLQERKSARLQNKEQLKHNEQKPQKIPRKFSIPCLPGDVDKDNPEADETNQQRKSIDNRSDISYGNPLTPADSGRCSESFGTDNEYDQDASPDNGMGPMQRLPENDASLNTLKKLFPLTFSDGSRTKILEAFYKDPVRSETYLEWEKFIETRIGSEHDFNVFDCGTDILNTLSDTTNKELSFESLVESKSDVKVCHLFLSTLELANSNNVQIINKYPGEVRKDNMDVKLLSTIRTKGSFCASSDEISEDDFMATLIANRKKQYCQSTPVQDEFEPRPGPSVICNKRRKLDYSHY